MKITNAMYMISSIQDEERQRKSCQIQSRISTRCRERSASILRHIPDIEHPVFRCTRPEIPKEKRKIGYIVVTADKGLAGAYNHNVIKMAEEIWMGTGRA